VARGLRVGDPDWFAHHHPHRRRYGRIGRRAAAVLALALVLLGAMTGVMPVVFCGVLLVSGSLTAHVSSRSGNSNRVGSSSTWSSSWQA
jgi:hypothetical protein